LPGQQFNQTAPKTSYEKIVINSFYGCVLLTHNRKEPVMKSKELIKSNTKINMNKTPTLFRTGTFAIVITFFSFSISIGQNVKIVRGGAAAREIVGSKAIHFNGNGTPRMIEFEERTTQTNSFINAMKSHLRIGDLSEMMLTKEEDDLIGMKHHRFQQLYKKLPVEGMEFLVHGKGNFIRSANGRLASEADISVKINPSLSESQSFDIALESLQADLNKQTSIRGNLMITSKDYTYQPGSFHLAYQFEIFVSNEERWWIYVDAHTGEVVNKVSKVMSCFKSPEPLPYVDGTGQTNYYGVQNIKTEQINGMYRLHGQTASGGLIETYDYNAGMPVDFQDPDNNFTDANALAGVTAQWGTEKVYEYYKNLHSRNSYDNMGAIMKAYAHAGSGNASWSGTATYFGDGIGSGPLVPLDMVAHEWTHAVTQYSAKLIYQNESGALNESFSDILGKAIDFSVPVAQADWLIGSKVYNGTKAFRSFSNPNKYQQPDTYLGDLWENTFFDNGGVHYNSGVQNFWFYLLSNGGSGTNDKGLGYNIPPIGITKAEAIAHRNLTQYLVSSSEYIDSRLGSLMATADLYGNPSAEYSAVDAAWDAVGVYDEPLMSNVFVTDMTGTTATLNVQVKPNESGTTVHFEYGLTPAYGNATAPVNIGNGKTYVIVSTPISGLTAESVYYVRAIATNQNGTSYQTGSFLTYYRPVITSISPAKSIIGETVTINGSNFNPVGANNIVHFGAVKATVLSGNQNSLQVKVPFGASFGPLTVTNLSAGLTATSPEDFTPLFGGSFNGSSQKMTYRGNAKYNAYTPVRSFVYDWDDDSKPDIILLNENGGYNVLQNKHIAGAPLGSNSFIQNYGQSYSNGFRGAIADMNGDGKKDLIYSTPSGFAIHLNLSTINNLLFGSPIDVIMDNAVGTPIRNIVAADFDSNGTLDVAVENLGNKSVEVYSNNNQKVNSLDPLLFVKKITLPIGFVILGMDAGDIDKDGKPDLLVGTNKPSSHFFAYHNETTSSSNFAFAQQSSNLPLSLPSVTNFAIGDLNEDGKKDIASVRLSGNLQFGLYQNASLPGTISLSNFIWAGGPDGTRDIKMADMDGNGKIDLVVGTNTPAFKIFSNQINTAAPITSAALLEVGNFSTGTILLKHYPDMAVNDLNFDGTPDVVNIIGDGNTIEIYENTLCAFKSLGITITNTSLSSTNISWDDLDGVGNYILEFSIKNSGNWNSLNVNGATNQKLSNLTSWVTYQVRVKRICDANNFSDWYLAEFATGCDVQSGYAIYVGDIGSAVCKGSLSVPYFVKNSFPQGNIFTAQLSDSNGSFANPLIVGSISSTTSGSIWATIPANIIDGIGYRVRVISSNPSIISCNDDKVIIGIGQNYINVLAGTYCGPVNPPNIVGNIPYAGTYQWQQSGDGNNWTNVIGATTKDYDPVQINTTTHYRRVVTAGGCSYTSGSVSFVILPAIGNNSLGSGIAFCGLYDPPIMEGSTPTGGNGQYGYQWESSIDNVHWIAAVPPATTKDYDPPMTTQTTFYHRLVFSGVCLSISNSSVIRIDQQVANNTISNNGGNFCGPTDPANIIGSVPTGGDGGGSYNYQWQSMPDGGALWTNIANATSKDYNPPVVNSTTYYRRVITSGACNNDQFNWSASNYIEYIITPLPLPQNITASGTKTICLNGGSVTLSVPYVPGTSYQWKKNGGSLWTNIAGATYNSFTVFGGAANVASYRVDMTTCDIISSNNTVNVTMFNCTAVGYCESRGMDSQLDWLDLVSLNTLNNPSGNDGGYADYTSLLPPDLSPADGINKGSGAYGLALSAGNTVQVRDRYFKVWIDFNRNGSFIDVGEEVLSIHSTSTGTLATNIVIPQYTPYGLTRLRVSMRYGSAPTGPCDIFSNGEVEDYTVNIYNSNGPVDARIAFHANEEPKSDSQEEILLYPNPIDGVLKLSEEMKSCDEMIIIDAIGHQVFQGACKHETDVSTLTPGVYILIIKSASTQRVFRFVKN
jgi:Zn-dependent metalloprotease